jgi:hypothetical protein
MNKEKALQIKKDIEDNNLNEIEFQIFDKESSEESE